MHELPVTQEILDIALRHAGERRITAITLVIGELSGFIDDSIQFYFNVLAQGTGAEGAVLHFKRVPVRFRCRQCGTEFAAALHAWHCPHCQAMGGEVIAGKEFFVESIEVVEPSVLSAGTAV